MNKLLKAIKNPDKLALYALSKPCISKLFSDEAFLKMKYRLIMGKKLDLDNPKTFNEKLQWLKLHDRKAEYTMMVDKYAVRGYIAEKLGEEYLIPLLGVWDDPDDIDFDALPDKFVLKCNHNSGTGMCICRDKSKLDIEKVKKELRKGLKQDYYLTGREWPYKNVKRKILAEKFMADDTHVNDLPDYKFFCFSGEPRIILVCSERFSKGGLRENFYDINWNLLELQRPTHKNTEDIIEKPKNLGLMLDLAKKLSQNIEFSRIDFYEVNGKVFFGEITFFPASGFEEFTPEEWDYKLGEYIKLSN